jgi:hypothetical protein
VHDRLRRRVEGKLGCSRTGDDAEPGGADARAQVRVGATGDAVTGPAAPELAHLAAQVWRNLLHGERHAGQRPLAVGLERGLEQLADRGTEGGLDLADRPPDGVLDLGSGDRACAQEGGQTDRVVLRVVAQVQRGPPLPRSPAYAGSSATARTGEPVPPSHLSG